LTRVSASRRRRRDDALEAVSDETSKVLVWPARHSVATGGRAIRRVSAQRCPREFLLDRQRQRTYLGRMRTPRTIAAAMAIALVASLTADAQAAPQLAKRPAPPRAERPRIVNGVFTASHPTVGALLTPSAPALAESSCSGTMIGCETFLTAAHCVCDGEGSDCGAGGIFEPDPDDYVVFLQHAGFFAVSSVAVHPDYAFPTADVAVLKLASPVTRIRPTEINTVETPPDGSTGTIVGFGRSGGGNFDYGLKRVGNIETETSGCDSDQVCWVYENPVGPPGDDSNTCNADSGGPLFWDPGTGEVIAGITSGGDSSDCNPTDFSYDADVFTYRAYIQSEGGADLAQTSCGAGAQIGDAGVTVIPLQGALSAGNTSDAWSFAVPVGTVALRVAQNAGEQGSADFDLYVKQGSAPTTTSFDCKADGSTQYGFCEFANPTAGTWHVLVNRFSGSADYQVTATVVAGACHAGNDGAPCDDGNACTESDACLSSACVGSAVVDGTLCDDGEGCTSNDSCQVGVCTGAEAPQTGCAVPVAPRASTLVLKDLADERDLLTWTWRRGEATSKEDFGDPTAGATYDLCIFEETAGNPSLVLDAEIPSGSEWDESSSGYEYNDPAAAAFGIRKISLRAGLIDGQSRIQLKAKGLALPMPSLPLDQDPTVTIQLVGENTCWEARFSTASSNQLGRFRARSD
jgi:hypothetical protein